MKQFGSIATLLAVITGLLVLMLVSVFSNSAITAYSRKQEANHTLMVVRRTADMLVLKETVRVELGVVDTALQAPEPASAQTIEQIIALHGRSEGSLARLAGDTGDGAKLRARRLELQKKRITYNRVFPRVLASLRSARKYRPQGVPAEWTSAVVEMLNAVDAESKSQSDTIVNADTLMNELMKVNEIAWSMRAIAGTDRRSIATAILEGRPLSVEQREAFAETDGRIGALWTQIEYSNSEHIFPPRLNSAFQEARRVYVVAYREMRKDIISRLARRQPINLSGEAWLRRSNPGLNSIIAISKNALALTELRAAELAGLADRNFNVAVGLMLLSIWLASSAMLYVMWRVIVPLNTITRTMRSIAGGDPNKNIPFGHRQDEIGQFSAALRMFRDSAVVQQRLETESLRNLAARNAADTSNRLKSEFLANMSHELRTPLNAILGFSEMIGAEILGSGLPQYRVYANDIHSAGSHLLSLINDILDLSKAEAGRLELQCEYVDVAELVKECMRLLHGRAAEHKLHLSLIKSRLSLPSLFADRLRIKQVLLNLLSNAIKFTPDGGQVSVGADLDPLGRLVIKVCDTGIGIAPEMIPLAFEPFRQVDSTLSRKFEGTGLGLSLVSIFMKLHGGEVKIESVPGRGTTVSIRFPESRCADAPAAKVG